MAAQIVAGVGFFGAGLILARQSNVKGLTTAAAAGLWLLALAEGVRRAGVISEEELS